MIKENPANISLIREIRGLIQDEKRVRKSLPEGGILNIDRQLPFLLVYRQPENRVDYGTEKLITGEASFLLVSAKPKYHRFVTSLVTEIAEILSERLGAFLILEIWSEDRSNDKECPIVEEGPEFKVLTYLSNREYNLGHRFKKRLEKIKLNKTPANVKISRVKTIYPKGLKPLYKHPLKQESKISFIGLEVTPVYQHPEDTQDFPLTLRPLRKSMARVLKQFLFDFVNVRTELSPPHFYSLGRNAMVKSVWDVDRQLAEVSDSFDLLLAVTPVNVEEAYRRFKKSGYREIPRFEYRPRMIEPQLLKRKLYKVPLERLEDPVLSQIFFEKQEELDRQITLITDRGTSKFLYGSLQLYGDIKDSQHDLAVEIMEKAGAHPREKAPRDKVDARYFLKQAKKEISAYRSIYPEFNAEAEIVEGLSSLMVSRNKLMIGEHFSVARSRVLPLLQHEVGTHLLTYFNGKAQPFKQLYTGLAGYDETQEGLAVMAEYLVGGLSLPRMRVLAARVITAKNLTDGADFIEAFDVLTKTYGMTRVSAFTITKRIFRGGGFIKDAIYLRGWMKMINYLKSGGDFELLLSGKLNTKHVAFVKELRMRHILKPPAVEPLYMNNPAVPERMNKIKNVNSPVELLGR